MSAADIARVLRKGRRNSRGWTACCPVHPDRNPSLSLSDGEGGRLLVRCWFGCDPVDVLKAINRLSGIDANSFPQVDIEQLRIEVRRDVAQRTAKALAIWRESRPATGSPVERYLRMRGYQGPLPPTVRHHPAIRHSHTGLMLPAMVAAVTVWPSRRLRAVHRTFITPDGSAKAPVDPNKVMLGPVREGAVRLAPVAPTMAIAEGIETALAVLQATAFATWAALSAGGIEALNLPSLPMAADILIAADNDSSGRGFRAAQNAAERWIAEGRQVRISMPSEVGTDWADIYDLSRSAS